MQSRIISTELLDIDLQEWGDASSPAVFLLHGWPDSPRTWRVLAPELARAGFRVLVPALRGYAGTRFRNPHTPRSGQLTALAQDVLDLADALGVQHFDVVGHDWGARAAYILACLWPHRVERCAALSVAWGTNQPQQKLSYQQAHNYWYHWFMHLPRGQQALSEDRRHFTRYLWQVWAPNWSVPDEEFEATAAAFDNPDWAEVVIHSYTHRWGAAPSDPRYEELEARLSNPPLISVPSLLIHGANDGANGVATTVGREVLFSGPYRRIVLPDCGHFPQREHPQEVNAAILEFLRR